MDVEVVPGSYMDDLYDSAEEKVSFSRNIFHHLFHFVFLLGCLGCFNAEEFCYWESESEGQYHRAGTAGQTHSLAG